MQQWVGVWTVVLRRYLITALRVQCGSRRCTIEYCSATGIAVGNISFTVHISHYIAHGARRARGESTCGCAHRLQVYNPSSSATLPPGILEGLAEPGVCAHGPAPGWRPSCGPKKSCKNEKETQRRMSMLFSHVRLCRRHTCLQGMPTGSV